MKKFTTASLITASFLFSGVVYADETTQAPQPTISAQDVQTTPTPTSSPQEGQATTQAPTPAQEVQTPTSVPSTAPSAPEIKNGKYKGKIVSFDGTKLVIQIHDKTLELPVDALTGKHVEVIVKNGFVQGVEIKAEKPLKDLLKKKGLENAKQHVEKNANAVKRIQHNLTKQKIKHQIKKEVKQEVKQQIKKAGHRK
jgi:sulfur carrier protein ThiS